MKMEGGVRMDMHSWLDYLVKHENPWLSDIEPLPGFNRAVVRLYAKNVLDKVWSINEAHDALDALLG